MELMVAGQRVSVPEIEDPGVNPPTGQGTPGPDLLPDFIVGDEGGQADLLPFEDAPAQGYSPDAGTAIPGGPMPLPETFEAPSLPPGFQPYSEAYLDVDPRIAQFTPGNPYRNVRAEAQRNDEAILLSASRPTLSLDGDVAVVGTPHYGIISGMNGDHNPAHAWATEQRNAQAQKEALAGPGIAGDAARDLFSDDDPRRPWEPGMGEIGAWNTATLAPQTEPTLNMRNQPGLSADPVSAQTANIVYDQQKVRRKRRGRRSRSQQPNIPDREANNYRSTFWHWYDNIIPGPVPGVILPGRFPIDTPPLNMPNPSGSPTFRASAWRSLLRAVGASGRAFLTHVPGSFQFHIALGLKAFRGRRDNPLNSLVAFPSRGRALMSFSRKPVSPLSPWLRPAFGTTAQRIAAGDSQRKANVKNAWDRIWWTRPGARTNDWDSAVSARSLTVTRARGQGRRGSYAPAAVAPPPATPSANASASQEGGIPSPFGGDARQTGRAPRDSSGRGSARAGIFAHAQQRTQPSLTGLSGPASSSSTLVGNPGTHNFFTLVRSIQNAYGITPVTGVMTTLTTKVIRAAIASGSREGRALAKIFYFPPQGQTRSATLGRLGLYDPRTQSRVQLIISDNVPGIHVPGAASGEGERIAHYEARAAQYMDSLAGLDKRVGMSSQRSNNATPGVAEKALVKSRDENRRRLRLRISGKLRRRPIRLKANFAGILSKSRRAVAQQAIYRLSAQAAARAAAAQAAANRPGVSPEVAQATITVANNWNRAAGILGQRAGAVGSGGASEQETEEALKEATDVVADTITDNTTATDNIGPPTDEGYTDEGSPPDDGGYTDSTYTDEDYDWYPDTGVDPAVQAAIDAANAQEEAADQVTADLVDTGELDPGDAEYLLEELDDDGLKQQAVGEPMSGTKKAIFAAVVAGIAWKAGLFG